MAGTLGGMLNFIRSSKYYGSEQLNKLIEETLEQTPPIKGDTIERRIVKDGEHRVKNLTVVTATDIRTKAETRGRGIIPFNRKRPETVSSYPLIHSTTGTLTFPGDNTTKFGGCAEGFSNSNYITVNDHSLLDVATELTIAFFLRVPTTNPADNATIIAKADAYEIFLSSARVLNARIKSSAAWKTAVTHDVSTDSGNWISVVFTYKSTSSGQTLYIDAVSESSDAETGSIDTNTNNLEIGNDADNVANMGIAHLTMLSKEVTSGWVTNFDGGLLDTSDGNDEITTIPFVAHEEPRPDATAGEARST